MPDPSPLSPYRVCLLDALGTTVRLLPPWERIDPEFVAGLPPERVRSSFAAEMSYYAAHAHEATNPERLSELRDRCAELLSEGLGRQVTTAALMDSIAFEAYEDAAPTLAEIRALGLTTVCVSNWDCDLPAVLERVGLADAFDEVVASALAGARKPDPAIFERALELIGCTAGEALHIGDSDDDVEGATAAGIDVIRVGREDAGDVRSLAEVAPLLRAGGRIGQHSRR